MIAKDLSIDGFKASCGWVSKFILRNSIQSSIKLHENGNSLRNPNHGQRLEEIRELCAEYLPENVYNQDEHGLISRLCQNRSYLSTHESRRKVRCTLLQMSKQRITVSFATNVDASHKVPIRYIGSSKTPLCFRDHPKSKENYSHQPKAWMDASQFKIWHT